MKINISSVKAVPENRSQSTVTNSNSTNASNSTRSNSNSTRSNITRNNSVEVLPARQNWCQNTNIQAQNNVNQNQPRQPQPNQQRQFMPPPAANRAQNRPNSGAMPTPGASDGDDNNVLCGCNQPAIMLTVRKQNANFGKFLFITLIFIDLPSRADPASYPTLTWSN